MPTKPKNSALQLTRERGLVRARDLVQQGVYGAKLQQLLHSGTLVRVDRGLYAPAGRTPSELAQLAIRYPPVVFCLLTALQLHGLTTQAPHEVWVAVGPKARSPNPSHPPLRVVRFSDPAIGTETQVVDGVVHILVTSVAKTVADCFKFRNKIGLDVALEALREAWRQRRVTMDELWEAARLCRVANVMRPYLESLM